jgi:hypothetical protein
LAGVFKRIKAVLIAEKDLQRHQHDQKIERHAHHHAGVFGRPPAPQQPGADAHHDEGGGDVKSGDVVEQPVRKRRIENDRHPVGRLETAVDYFITLGRLHP